MSARSYLFVPADSDRKLEKSRGADADALIIDLEDSVTPEQKPAARQRAHDFLQGRGGLSAELWVRINPLDTEDALADLVAIVPAGPDGIVLPKMQSVAELIRLANYLDALEVQHDVAPRSIAMLPIVTETPTALFALDDLEFAGSRLSALTWGAEDLATAIGATTNRMDDGSWSAPFELARSLCLFAASAAELAAVDTLCADFSDDLALRSSCQQARRDGFAGKLAIHPRQVPIINECFTPSETELARAKAIVELFEANPGQAALSLDGQMVDIPHLRQAQRLLERA
ncbi:MAG: CoA ester lyase [Pseudomonadota bacterium]